MTVKHEMSKQKRFEKESKSLLKNIEKRKKQVEERKKMKKEKEEKSNSAGSC